MEKEEDEELWFNMSNVNCGDSFVIYFFMLLSTTLPVDVHVAERGGEGERGRGGEGIYIVRRRKKVPQTKRQNMYGTI